MYKKTVTLFNRYVDSMGNTMWFPHVLKNVNLNTDKAVINSRYGSESKDNAVLNVKYHQVGTKKMIGAKPYFMPKEWERQVNDELPNCITFKSGNDFDFFMLGNYGSTEPIEDTKGTFFRELENEYDYVFAITSVAEFGLMEHFEITGK